MPAGSEGSVEIKGVFYASEDAPVYLDGQLSYTPSFGSNTKQVVLKNKLGVRITSAPMALELQSPRQAADGDRVEYVIDYKNLSSAILNDVQVRVKLPVNFEFSGAQPLPLPNNSFWNIGNLEQNQTGQIHIQGVIRGSENQNQSIKVEIGVLGEDGDLVVYNNKESGTQIVAPILAINQRLEKNDNGIINAGDVLKVFIDYKNNSNIGLRDCIITAKITGKVLDFAGLNTSGGAFDDKNKTITWKASSVPGLRNIDPGLSGSIFFTLPVKNIIPVENGEDKNFIVTSVAKIDSPDIPTTIEANKSVGSNELVLKLSSKLLGNTYGFYNDTDLKNSGPLPLTVGKETTFTMKWSLGSVSNDVADVKVTSVLPSGIRWLSSIFPGNEKLTYDDRTNQLTWDVGTIFAGTGVKGAPREVKFQIGVTPQPNQAGTKIVLLGKTTIAGRDLFVGKDVSITLPEKNSELTEDPSVGFVGGQVAK
jgi:hypothetical protein